MSVRVVYEQPRFGVKGSVVVCCIHGVAKRQVTDVVYDKAKEQIGQCLCCLNLYATDLGDPIIPCHECRPRRAA